MMMGFTLGEAFPRDDATGGAAYGDHCPARQAIDCVLDAFGTNAAWETERHTPHEPSYSTETTFMNS
jgi:hypothetical protein